MLGAGSSLELHDRADFRQNCETGRICPRVELSRQLTSPRPLSGIIWRGKEAWEILRVQYTVGQNTRVSRSLDF